MMQDKLRIAMLSAHSCPVGDLGARDTGGMSVYIRELAGELGKQGHYVDVYTRVHDPRDPVVVELGPQARLIHLKAGQPENMHKLAIYCFLPEFACNLENYRKSNDLHYDLIFSHYWLSGWVGGYLQRWWQVPHAIMFHTLGDLKNDTGIGEAAPDLRIVTERASVEDCQRIIVATDREKAELTRRYSVPPGKIGVTPCGVNVGLFRPIDKTIARQELKLNDDKILLFVGRIDPMKGIDQLIKALPYLPSQEHLRLLVIGGDEDSRSEIEKLQKLSVELNVPDMVDFRGRIEHDRLPCYYSAADVCIVPSYYESFGLVALESLACGTPVVATDVGDMKNIIRQGETGYVIADNSPEKIAGAVAELLSVTNRDRESTLAIRASVSRFDWQYIAEKVLAEIQLLLDGRITTPA